MSVGVSVSVLGCYKSTTRQGEPTRGSMAKQDQCQCKPTSLQQRYVVQCMWLQRHQVHHTSVVLLPASQRAPLYTITHQEKQPPNKQGPGPGVQTQPHMRHACMHEGCRRESALIQCFLPMQPPAPPPPTHITVRAGQADTAC